MVIMHKGEGRCYKCGLQKSMHYITCQGPFTSSGVSHASIRFLYHVERQESQQLAVLTVQQNMILISLHRGHIEEKVVFH